MNKKELTNKINTSLNNSIPNDFDNILLKCQKKKGNTKMEKGEAKKIVTSEVDQKSKILQTNKLITRLSIGFALMLLVLSGVFYGYNQSYKVDSVIELDVNPSIELDVSKNDKVIKALAKNEEAREILKGMDLSQTDIDVALNAIIGSMVTKGYIDELSNSILITVENDNKQRSEELRTKLVNQINSILDSDKINASVLSQNMIEQNKKEKSSAQRLAEKYNISEGKAILILEILDEDKTLKAKDLAGLSINELNVLSEGKTKNLDFIKKEGTANTNSYIGKDKAKQVALNHAGVSNPKNVKVEFDADDGLLIYEVEFNTSTKEYEYEISAKTGKVVKYDTEVVERDDRDDYDDYNYNSDNQSNKTQKRENEKVSNNRKTTSGTNRVSKSKAKQIAFRHAGLSVATNFQIEFEREDDEYQIEFISNGYEYEYEINATTGKIIDYDKERLDRD